MEANAKKKSSFPGVQNLVSNGAANILNETSKQMAVKAGKVSFLSYEQLRHSPCEDRIYCIKITDDIIATAHDIARRGLMNPLRVIPIDADTYEIVSGHRRYTAIGYAIEHLGYQGAENIPCIVSKRPFKGREFETTEDIILNNLQRDKTDYERMMEIVEFKRCTELRKEAGEDIPHVRDRIEQCLGVSNTEITRFLKIHTSMIPELLEAFRDGAIASTVAYEVAKLDAECQKYIAEVWPREDEPTLTLAIVNFAAARYMAPVANETKQDDENKMPKKASKPVIAIPKDIDEGVEMLTGAFTNIQRALTTEIKMDNKSRSRLLKQIGKHLAQLAALQNELAELGLVPDDNGDAE